MGLVKYKHRDGNNTLSLCLLQILKLMQKMSLGKYKPRNQIDGNNILSLCSAADFKIATEYGFEEVQA